MGFVNRKADLEYKRLEYEDREKQRAHELKQREVDAAILEKEYAARVQVATIEGESKVEAEAFEALERSYDFAKPEGNMAAFSSFVRPFISISYFVMSSLGAGYILYYAFNVEYVRFTHEQLYKMCEEIIAWSLFMASTTIGWWFGMRAGKAPPSTK